VSEYPGHPKNPTGVIRVIFSKNAPENRFQVEALFAFILVPARYVFGCEIEWRPGRGKRSFSA